MPCFDLMLFFSSWAFFRSIAISDQGIHIAKIYGRRSIPDSVIESFTERPVLKWLHPKVLFNTVLFMAPFMLHPILGNSIWIVILLYFSLSTYLAPLSLPSQIEPDAADIRDPVFFLYKWYAHHFSTSIISVVLVVFFGLLTFLPGVRVVGDWLANMFFPIAETGNSSAIFHMLRDGIVVVWIVMILGRSHLVLARGIAETMYWTAGNVYTWFGLQYQINVVLGSRMESTLIFYSTALGGLLVAPARDYILLAVKPKP